MQLVAQVVIIGLIQYLYECVLCVYFVRLYLLHEIYNWRKTPEQMGQRPAYLLQSRERAISE